MRLFLGCASAAAATGNRFLRTLTGARIRARALTVNGQIATMAHAPVATDLDQAFDVHLHFAAQIAFNLEFLRDVLTQ